MVGRSGAILWITAAFCAAASGAATVRAFQDPATPPTSLENALPAGASGEQIFLAACAACHGSNGAGAPSSQVGFALPLPNGHDLPDFNDCATNTVEPAADWIAVVTRGGRIRGLDRRMPAFGDALSADQIAAVVSHVRALCADRTWPRGDLNFPRAFFTEKAFPENELVWTAGVSTADAGAVTNEIQYEHRLGARGQYEITVPIAAQQAAGGAPWIGGVGDIEVALRRTLYASAERGHIFAAGGAVTLPSGSRDRGLGNGFTIVEPFAMWGQTLGANGALQVHAGLEIPSDHERGRNEGFVRTAVGYTLAGDHGFGRTWTPMAELLVAAPAGEPVEWDVVPQVQVSLSKLQHVMLDVGVRIPLNQRQEREPQLLTYFLWDWFDGGLFQFWR